MRLFVAFDLRDAVRQGLADLTKKLKPLCKSARWARPEGMHVTLKFIGHVIDEADTRKLDSLCAALAAVRSDVPVEMHFRGVGFFPDAHQPRVLWCGVKGCANLAMLAAGVQDALEPLGIPRDEHEFVPHLTLARFNKLSPVEKFRSSREGFDELARSVAELPQNDFGSVRESEFHLFESLLKPTGAEYKKIQTYSFVKESA
jgi:2'-5' RNA ligase